MFQLFNFERLQNLQDCITKPCISSRQVKCGFSGKQILKIRDLWTLLVFTKRVNT